MDKQQPVLVTGCAGFIGFYLTKRLLKAGCQVIGVDVVNDYYSQQLKRDRLAQLESPQFHLSEFDLSDRAGMSKLFGDYQFGRVFHLAAQAGVRYSLTNPQAYVTSNLEGFLNILECCRHHNTAHLIYASSSSVYGLNTGMPFSASHSANHPVSLYAATKKANEMMAHSYGCTFGLPTTGLRFFTVYGPWGRPDMALYIFARAIMRGEPIKVFNYGKMRRDFTYVDDIVEGVLRVGELIPAPDPTWDSLALNPSRSSAPYRIFNIGNHQPVELGYFIDLIEERLKRKAIREYVALQPGDVPETYADIDDLRDAVGFAPQTTIEEGVARSMDWYLEYSQRNPDL